MILRRFVLRPLLVVVALLGAVSPWIAYHRSIALERLAIRAKLEAKGAMFEGLEGEGLRVFDTPAPAQLPWIRRLFADEPIWVISFPDPPPSDSSREARRYFPEADFGWHVVVTPIPPPSVP